MRRAKSMAWTNRRCFKIKKSHAVICQINCNLITKMSLIALKQIAGTKNSNQVITFMLPLKD